MNSMFRRININRISAFRQFSDSENKTKHFDAFYEKYFTPPSSLDLRPNNITEQTKLLETIATELKKNNDNYQKMIDELKNLNQIKIEEFNQKAGWYTSIFVTGSIMGILGLASM